MGAYVRGSTIMFETLENNLCFEVHVIHHTRWLGKGDVAGHKLCG